MVKLSCGAVSYPSNMVPFCEGGPVFMIAIGLICGIILVTKEVNLMGYRVIYKFSDGTKEDLLDEIFDTKEQAEAAALEGEGNYICGTNTLMLGGHDYDEAKITGWNIVRA
jgi:hypothetical protein